MLFGLLTARGKSLWNGTTLGGVIHFLYSMFRSIVHVTIQISINSNQILLESVLIAVISNISINIFNQHIILNANMVGVKCANLQNTLQCARKYTI